MSKQIEHGHALSSTDGSRQLVSSMSAHPSNEGKFTPGEWVVNCSPSAVRGMTELDVVFPGGKIGAKDVEPFVIATINTVYFEPHMEEPEANARLISASPALLSALEQVMLWVNSGWNPKSSGKVMRDAHAAISKAKGTP
jgi:hypothetical protein